MTNQSEIDQLMQRYLQILERGDDEAAKEFMLNDFPKLPKDLQDRLMIEMLDIAVNDAAEGSGE